MQGAVGHLYGQNRLPNDGKGGQADGYVDFVLVKQAEDYYCSCKAQGMGIIEKWSRRLGYANEIGRYPDYHYGYIARQQECQPLSANGCMLPLKKYSD